MTKKKKTARKTSKKEALVALLKDRVPSLFERMPRSSVSDTETEKLADEILDEAF